MPHMPRNALAAALLEWYAVAARKMPWRGQSDPYKIWISEIMLQQTRVEAVRGYYARFLEALPTVADLAKAPDDGLGKLWEGLGYYSRMRNLRAAAQVVQEKWNGQIPRDYDAVRSLPGIGDYTAGAICSIAFDLPVPAVDGNVLRVAARVGGCRLDILDQKNRRQFRRWFFPERWRRALRRRWRSRGRASPRGIAPFVSG